MNIQFLFGIWSELTANPIPLYSHNLHLHLSHSIVAGCVYERAIRLFIAIRTHNNWLIHDTFLIRFNFISVFYHRANGITVLVA